MKRRIQLERTVTYIRTRCLKTLLRKLSEEEYLIINRLISYFAPSTVGATIDMFNNIDVYNKCIHQWVLDLGQKSISEIVLEQVAKAKDQLKLGEVANAAELCFGIILGVELANRDIEDDEGRYLQQARADACALVSYFPIKK